jgi:hypothetical protein
VASKDENCRRNATFGSRNGFRHAPKVDASTWLVGGRGYEVYRGWYVLEYMHPIGCLWSAGVNAQGRISLGISEVERGWVTRKYEVYLMADASTNADALGLLIHTSQSFTMDHG